MEINGLLMDLKDNVVTCVALVPAGEQVVYRRGDEICTLTAQEEIPYCHKVALADLAEGDQVIKYGELIGRTTALVEKDTGCPTTISTVYPGIMKANLCNSSRGGKTGRKQAESPLVRLFSSGFSHQTDARCFL